VPRLVTIVEPDVHDVGIVFRNGVDVRAHALGGGEIPRGRNFLTSGGRSGRIHRVDVEVLVAELILHEEDVLAVAGPEILGHRPLGVVRQELGGGVRIAGALDPDISGVLVRLEERDVAAIRRQLRIRDFRVAEEQLAVDKWRELVGLRRCDRRRGEGDGDREGPACCFGCKGADHLNLLDAHDLRGENG
jgi:hypothetical protein